MIPLLVVLPITFAFIGMLLTAFDHLKRYVKVAFLAGIFSPWSIFLLNLSDYPVEEVVGGWSRISGIEIGMGMINHYFLLSSLIVFSAVGVYSLFYFDGNKSRREHSGLTSYIPIFPLILLLYGGILGSFISRDLFNFYIYMEIASISSIILVGYSNEKGAKFASYRYLMLFFLSSFFFIFTIGIIYMNTGSLNFEVISENLTMTTEVKVAISIAFVSFITKAGIFPLHYWLPEAHSKADSPVSALLSGVTVKVPIFGMILFLEFTDIGFLVTPLMIVAFSSILFGIAMALMQNNIKKLLAYHTVSQMGYVLLGIASLNLFTAAHYAFAHTLFKSGLFLGAGVLITRYGTKDLDVISCRDNKLLMVSMTILTLAIGGISPLIGAFGKHEILSSLSGFGVYLFYAGTIGTLVSFIKLDYKIFEFKGWKKFAPDADEIIVFIMAVLTIAFGIYFYPKLNYLDIVLITIAFLIFFAFKYIGLFKKKVPRYFSMDTKGLGGEINLYTTIFVLINISVLFFVLY